MRFALAITVMLFSACFTACAQDLAAPAKTGSAATETTAPPVNRASAGCGPAGERFAVTKGSKDQTNSRPEAGKALIYFVQDDRFFTNKTQPTIKWGLDGAWVGATQHLLYFRMTIEPGEHRLCSEWQAPDTVSKRTIFGAAILHARAGQTYYYRAQSIYWGALSMATLSLLPVGRDQGALLDSQKGYSNFALKN
ncbi:MAG: hypothetical protein WA823_08945 [Candidatus Acidiferrales bacterium]